MADDLETFLDVLSIIVDIFIFLSLIGSLATIITFAIFKDLRTYPIKLIMYLCTAIFLAQLFFFVAFYTGDTDFCIPSAFLFHFFFLATFIWSFCVAFNFYQMIIRRNREPELLEKWFHLAAWLIPAIIVIIIGATGNYARLDTGICYMSSSYAIYGGFFLPGLITVSASLVLFFFIVREIHDTISSSPQAEQRDKSREWKVYFSIFASIGLSWLFGFIMLVFPEGVGQLIFLILYSLTTPLQGFLVFLAYCINARVAGKWAGLIGKVIPYFQKWENLGTTKSTGSSRNA